MAIKAGNGPSGTCCFVCSISRWRQHSSASMKVGPVSLRLPSSKGTIASRLNLTAEHFSRVLHQLSEAGLIGIEKRVTHIAGIHRLRASASGIGVPVAEIGGAMRELTAGCARAARPQPAGRPRSPKAPGHDKRRRIAAPKAASP
ncbi:MAG: winged helix-turn-helix domain-containing protein [Betaproteobacteria bacterium]|nr:winged helix-turn-helix domain-containing protein [Betaproteobacteria bacterium]